MNQTRWFFKSKYIVSSDEDSGKKMWQSETYRYRHLSPSIRGKLKIKAAKKLRVKAMKAQQEQSK